MAEEKTPADATEEILELNRALTELRAWRAERQQSLSEVEKFIHHSLGTGKMTARHKSEPGRKYLTERMIATLGLQCSLFKRSILLMSCRERQICARLNDLAQESGSAPAAQEKESA